MNGILGVDKARGPTSHDVVETVRRAVSLRRVGHAGTLDPDASGVLVLCLGTATKVSRFLMEREKEYIATCRLGFATDTGDRTGRPVGGLRPARVSLDRIESVCRQWVGEVKQVPPMVSAVKRGGVRLYKLARTGQTVDRSPRRVLIHSIDVLDVLLPFVRLRIQCGRGTYIRVLAEDIGEALGCGAHVFSLRRTRVGSVRLSRCVRLDEIRRRARKGRLAESVLRVEDALCDLPALWMDGEEDRRIRTGQWIRRQLSRVGAECSPWIRLHDSDGNLVAIGSVVEDLSSGTVTVRPERVLHSAG